MKEYIDKIRSGFIRFYADHTNKHCVQASLIEAAVAVGARTTNLSEALPESAIPPSEMIVAIQEGSTLLGMELVRVLITPGLLENAGVIVPDEVQSKVKVVTGMQTVQYPHIRLLFYENVSDDSYDSHAECDDRTERAKRRIDALLESGWITGAVVELKKK